MAEDVKIQIDGECQLCGFPGIIGMTCSECGGTIIAINDTKPVTKTEDDRYEDDDLLDDETVSLEDLAEEETEEKPDSFDDNEDI